VNGMKMKGRETPASRAGIALGSKKEVETGSPFSFPFPVIIRPLRAKVVHFAPKFRSWTLEILPFPRDLAKSA